MNVTSHAMRVRWRTSPSAVTSMLVVSMSCAYPTSALAEALAATDNETGICANGVVDKDKLALSLLQQYPVSAAAVSISSVDKLKNLSPQRQLYANEDPCSTASCSASDKKNIGTGSFRIREMLLGYDRGNFIPTNPEATPFEYMSGPNEQSAIKCVNANASLGGSSEAKVVKSGSTLLSQFRLRGSASALAVPRPDVLSGDAGTPTPFSTTDKATFDLLQNSAAGSRTSNILTFVGYAIPTSLFDLDGAGGNTFSIIPYAGINRDIVSVSKGSSVKPSVSNTADFGVIGLFSFLEGDRNVEVNHVLSVRPDYLFDFHDGSRLATLNFIYTPVLQGIANTYAPISINVKSGYFAYEPIFEVKSDIGHYTDRGLPGVSAGKKDFIRVGGEIGLGLVSQLSWLPVDISVTYARLYPANGGVRVGELNCVLSYNFTQYFSVSLKYLHGNREDTAKFEKQWELALSAKY
ncbi:hypothetical protein [Paraburkholderia kururiensis]|uniref:Uncharacterized protein n=1 Tax=Paraburkholderia kururiensis TaxID=984307 RepID=A0ABZ0WDU9_9BURK|nr:hypothetical protein [Paraburkholderia kururiensis]WQD75529.1 hypothetical protein U0042_15300 [Paraburkholderia kururiensis]